MTECVLEMGDLDFSMYVFKKTCASGQQTPAPYKYYCS